MKKNVSSKTITLTFVTLLSTLTGINSLTLNCPQSTLRHPLSKKITTVLIYMAGDNGLNEVVESNIQEMLAAGSSDEVNLLAHLHTKFPEQEKISKRLHLYNGTAWQCDTIEAMDSGHPTTLRTACEWALRDFPADHFILVLWGSAAGPGKQTSDHTPMRSTCYDESTGNYLSDADLRETLEAICTLNRNRKNIDIVAFDSCLQSGIEIAYAIQPHSDIMIATQAPAARDGYNYRQWLKTLYNNPSDMRAVATGMVETYEQKYKESGEEYALSAIDLTKLEPAVMGLRELARILTNNLHSDTDGTLGMAIRACALEKECPILVNCALGEWIGDIDAVQFCRNLCKTFEQMEEEEISSEPPSAIIPRMVKRALRSTIFARVTSPMYANTYGLSIYLPTESINPTYPSMLWARQTGWMPFLEALTKNNSNVFTDKETSRIRNTITIDKPFD